MKPVPTILTRSYRSYAWACFQLVFALAVVAGFWLLVIDALDRPVMYKRAVSGECARVHVYTEADKAKGYSCSNPPERYAVLQVDENWGR